VREPTLPLPPPCRTLDDTLVSMTRVFLVALAGLAVAAMACTSSVLSGECCRGLQVRAAVGLHTIMRFRPTPRLMCAGKGGRKLQTALQCDGKVSSATARWPYPMALPIAQEGPVS
jgi:hypothetical protein